MIYKEIIRVKTRGNRKDGNLEPDIDYKDFDGVSVIEYVNNDKEAIIAVFKDKEIKLKKNMKRLKENAKSKDIHYYIVDKKGKIINSSDVKNIGKLIEEVRHGQTITKI